MIQYRLVILIISFLLILFLIIYLQRFVNFEYDKVPDELVKLKNGLEQEKKINCQQTVTYCFEDSHCMQKCSNLAVCNNCLLYTSPSPRD